MTTASPQRLISSDDHVDLTQDKVKAHLLPKHHDSYDAAVARVEAELRGRNNVEVNRRWREQQNLAPSADQGLRQQRAAPGVRPARPHRPGRAAEGHGRRRGRGLVDATARSAPSATSTWSRTGWQEATRAFNTALAEFASADPKRLIVSYQIPIHDIDAAVKEVRWAAAEGCKSLQLPVFPAELGLPDYWDSRYDPLWSAIQDADLPICCHIGLNTQLEDLARRDPTPQKGIFVPWSPLSTAEALGMWVLTGVFERFPAAQGGLRRAGHRLGVVVAVHRRRHGGAAGLRVPGLRRCRATTSAATCS